MKAARLLANRAPAALLALLLAVTASPRVAQAAALAGHVPAAVAHLKPLRDFAGTNRLRLVVGLPLHNQADLDQLLLQLYDPAGTNYHRWLTPVEFGQRFGPTDEDYRKVIGFVQGKGLKVAGLSANRMLVDVEAPVADIEKALHVTLRLYPHPTEKRNFYAPDTEPTVDPDVAILHISGLDNFTLPHRLGKFTLAPLAATKAIKSFYTGSAPDGSFMGNDFRTAYVPGVTYTGAGQYIAIVDVGGLYYPNDIYRYELAAGLSTNIVVTNIVTTFTSNWTTPLTGSGTDDGEEALDICMAMSMAPGATILNYEGEAHDLFNQIALDNKAKQMTLSYGFGIDASIMQTFQQFLAQGQALSQASGDGDSDLDGGTGLTGNPYATIVGGTTLTTSGAGGLWSSETAWNWGGNGGSGGGISGYGIPTWQQGVATAANLGSAAYRNYPDVAMPADGVYLISKNGTAVGSIGGTSCASPLWAGFMALVNQRAASLGKPAVGFPNPAIYAIGKGPYATYASSFHDITTGNNFDSQNPTRFAATSGYDLCTGWGTPRGLNTIAALAGDGTNEFMFYPSLAQFNLVAGGSANATVTLTRLNGLTGSATFSITGLPAGITAAVNPISTSTTTTLSVSTRSNTVPGSYTATLTGTMGTLVHSVTLNFLVVAPIPGAIQINLASYYNRAGIYSDGHTFSGGLDAAYSSYSAKLLGATLSWKGLVFNLGRSNTLDVVDCAGQTIPLPAGSFNTLQLLGTAVEGSQSAQSFTVTYTDNSTATFTQSFSDWASPQAYTGEATVITMPYRNLNSGGSQTLNVTVDGYAFNLDPTRTVRSLTLPSNSNLILLSAMLASEPISVPLAAYYNRPGLYSDGVTFSNPATGGLDGGGWAYSATLLTGSQTWTNTQFNFGPANVTNVISAASQTIALPAGNYSLLRMLATGVGGNQTARSFLVKYADGTSSSFLQSLSDWNSPQNYAGESKAVTMGHRNHSDGTADNRTFYLYGYSFKLNSSKVARSFTLPADANLIVTAVSLVPNWPPTFDVNPFTEPNITAGQTISGTIATNASDLNGDSLTFGLVNGPAWLNISGSGVLSGRPLSAQVGINSFLVSVADPGGLSNTATMNLMVLPAPPIVPALVAATNGLWMNWSGGIAPYQLQMCTDLTAANWSNVGSLISSNSFSILPTNPATFYRLTGQ